jgi:hypothetical protein
MLILSLRRKYSPRCLRRRSLSTDHFPGTLSDPDTPHIDETHPVAARMSLVLPITDSARGGVLNGMLTSDIDGAYYDHPNFGG